MNVYGEDILTVHPVRRWLTNFESGDIFLVTSLWSQQAAMKVTGNSNWRIYEPIWWYRIKSRELSY